MDLMTNVNRTELETVEGGCIIGIGLTIIAFAVGYAFL